MVVELCHDALMMRYVATKPCHVSALCVGVHDPGETEWSCRRCTSLAFGKVSISLTSCGHLVLVVASHGSPCDTGVSGYSVLPWEVFLPFKLFKTMSMHLLLASL